MADKHIGALTEATDLDDDSLMVAEQQGTAVKVPGSLFKKFARVSVEAYVETAKTAAESAEQSAKEAADDLTKLGNSVEQAASSAEIAVNAQQAAQASEKAAAESAEAAELSVSNGKYINTSVGEDGHLYLKKTENAEEITMKLNEDGRLVMSIA
jgi:hypothetical protein